MMDEVITTVVIDWQDEPQEIRPYVEQLVNAWEDFAYGYMIDDAHEDITAALDDLDINYHIEEQTL